MEMLLKEWQEIWTPKLKERNIPNLDFNSKVRKIVTFTGVRRCGKTYIMFQVINHLREKFGKENIFYINFEDERIERKTETLTNLIPSLIKTYGDGNKKYFLFLDEVQIMPEWSKWLRRVYDNYKNIDFYVSGSTSKLSSKEIPTELRGRALDYEISPLSFKEFLDFKDIKIEDDLKFSERNLSIIKNLLNEYITYGGFPEIVLTDSEGNKRRIIQDYFRTIINKDILERYNLKNKSLLSDFFISLLNTTHFSINKTVNTFRSQGKTAGKNTIINYTRYAEESYFCYFLPIFSYKIKSQAQYPKKVYFTDNSFITGLSLKLSKNIGRLYENTVFLELKRKQSQNLFMDIYYWKNQQNEEVDFVVKENQGIKQLIQVCLSVKDIDTKQREIRSLLKASKEFKCKNLLLITEDYEGESEEEWFGIKERIKYIPLWKWLLE